MFGLDRWFISLDHSLFLGIYLLLSYVEEYFACSFVCAHDWCPQRQKEGIRFPVTAITDSDE